MLWNGSACAVAGGVGTAVQQRPVSKSPTVLPIAPQMTLASRSSSSTVVSSKGTAAVAPQPICISKPQQQLPQNSTSVLSQLGRWDAVIFHLVTHCIAAVDLHGASALLRCFYQSLLYLALPSIWDSEPSVYLHINCKVKS